MNKSRTVPIFTIADTDFEVDIEKQVLRQTNDRDNEISFINQIQDNGTSYRLHYDLIEKCAVKDGVDTNRVEVIDIPPLIRLDPEGMSEKYKLPVALFSGKTDFDIIVDQDALARRKEGVLPIIDIAGENFVFDLRLHEFRHARYFFPVISLKSFELTNDGWNYEAYFHSLIKQVVNIDPRLTEFPDHVIKIKLPNEIGLDPVGTAQHYGMDEWKLLRRYPIRKALKAELISLADTHIPGLIQRYKEQLQREHQVNARRMKPRQRPGI